MYVTTNATASLARNTTAQLREILAQADYKAKSRTVKADLIELILMVRERCLEDAYAENDAWECNARTKSMTEPALTFFQRSGNYLRQNNGGKLPLRGNGRKLTARQQRRAYKKYKRALSKGHNLTTVMGAL